MQKKELKPHVRILKLSGGTGDGKSEIASVFASVGARKIIGKSVGKTNSTLKERLIVYTDSIHSQILVAVKLNENILERTVYSDVITTVLAKFVRQKGKTSKETDISIEDELKSYFSKELKRNNTKAILSFLSQEQRTEFINNISECIANSDIEKKCFYIYNTVRNKLAGGEVKENSAKFLDELTKEVGCSIDSMDDEFHERLWSVWKIVNDHLKDFFFDSFDEENISSDRYYYKEIDINNPDDDFVDAMFCSNDIQDDGKLSLEVFCDEIVIYAPLDDRITQRIRENEDMVNSFSDSHGNISFGIFDTRGLFHANVEDTENKDYFTELLYHGDFDALLLVTPMHGDTNEIKLRSLYSEAFSSFKKQIPVFMINNKVDLFIDDLNKDAYADDPLSIETDNDNNLSEREIEERVDAQANLIAKEIENVQNKSRKNLRVIALPCYLKRDGNMPRKLVQKYNVMNVIMRVLEETATYLEATSIKIPYIIEDSIDEDIHIDINQAEVEKIVHRYLKKNATCTKIFSPGLQNIKDNIGLTPHGNGYNALRRRLRNGEGFNSRIDEDYYKNCDSFSIDFPGNLRNFINEELLNDLIHNAVKLEGGKYKEQSDEAEFIKLAIGNVRDTRFVADILYSHALLESESKNFSFKGKFNGFLKRAKRYFDASIINEDVYIESIVRSMYDAISRTIALNFIYK